MKLSPHFHLSEFTQSQTATRLMLDNNPEPATIAALRLLCEKVLEPVRENYGRPVLISSGYRSPEVNRALRGSRSSQHVKGEAADFEIAGISNLRLCQWMERRLNYDQLILEFYETDIPDSGWVHVSYREPYRNQELTARRVVRNGRRTTEYRNGIIG
ncbi:MAG: D-Ala-D-Ala carboxypeptidase family metallohydrolase [Parasphingorhabdus sp.]|uniref:D-Ala-D-Ala carboxypeptidase family metallohydrolase n=1 Tax=Parasphingorhabdus sp. TaxID=2709688 RepID=UPI003297FACD